MTPEELNDLTEKYQLYRDKFLIPVKNLVRMGIAAHSDIPKLLAHIKELESQISVHERICSLRTLANGMKKLCPDLVEELTKRVNEYNKKEDEKFSEIMTWLKGKEDESSSS